VIYFYVLLSVCLMASIMLLFANYTIIFFILLLAVPIALFIIRHYYLSDHTITVKTANIIKITSMIIVSFIGIAFVANLGHLGDKVGYDSIKGYHSEWAQETDNNESWVPDSVSIPTASGWLLLNMFLGVMLVFAGGIPFVTWKLSSSINQDIADKASNMYKMHLTFCLKCGNILDDYGIAYCRQCGCCTRYFKVYQGPYIHKMCVNHQDKKADAVCCFCSRPVCSECYEAVTVAWQDSPIYKCHQCNEIMIRLQSQASINS
jgi:hypothetical protein